MVNRGKNRKLNLDGTNSEIHVWDFVFNECPYDTSKIVEVLSPDEVERANRFKRVNDRNRYVFSYANLRVILGLYLNVPPASLQFEKNSFGKPYICGESNPQGLCFNMSHTGNVVMLAISLKHEVGIDIEKVREFDKLDNVAYNFLSSCEADYYNTLSKEKKKQFFFLSWVRKEALIKAQGKGVGENLSHSTVSQFSGAEKKWPPPTVSVVDEKKIRWSLQDVSVAQDYFGACCVEGVECYIIPHHCNYHELHSFI